MSKDYEYELLFNWNELKVLYIEYFGLRGNLDRLFRYSLGAAVEKFKNKYGLFPLSFETKEYEIKKLNTGIRLAFSGIKTKKLVDKKANLGDTIKKDKK